jgi:hypothetical protein
VRFSSSDELDVSHCYCIDVVPYGRYGHENEVRCTLMHHICYTTHAFSSPAEYPAFGIRIASRAQNGSFPAVRDIDKFDGCNGNGYCSMFVQTST